MCAVKKIVTVVGARPQFVKASVLSNLLSCEERLCEVLVHSGQHYDFNMSDQFFRDLNIPEPKHRCNLGLGSEVSQISQIMIAMDEILDKEKPDLVLVYGDTNTTLAASLMAAKLDFPLAHVESGLRSFRPAMSEEINRKLSDHLSDYHFCPTSNAVTNLTKEGITKDVFLVGDIMLDVFMNFQRTINSMKLINDLGLKSEEFYFATIHRAENVDNHPNLVGIIAALRSLSYGKKKVVFSVHPRTKKTILKLGLDLGNIHLTDPLPYPTTVACLLHASIVITDSGGLQKEAYFAETPCITIRDETEWIETLVKGHNRLLPPSQCCQLLEVVSAIENTKFSAYTPVYGDGTTGKQICHTLRNLLSV